LAGILGAASIPVAAPTTAKAAAVKAASAAAGPAARLKELERQAAESRARAAALAERTAGIERDLVVQRQSLAGEAAQVRGAEEALSRLEAEQAALDNTFGRESDVAARGRTELAVLTLGLVRLARIPPGAILVSEEAPVDAARAQILLQAAVVATRERAAEAERALARMDEAGRQLAAKRLETEQAATTLKTRQGELAALVEKRQDLYRRTESDRQTEDDRATSIAAEAKDLRDLVTRIEAEQAAEARREEQARKESARKAADRKAAFLRAPITPRQGHYNGAGALPVAGEVRIRFGQNDGLGATSRGVTIVTRPGATVTAPASGIVRFAGPFRDYRQILILEHPGGYLSLIAGLDRVSAAVKETVGAGEPVGTMDERPGGRPELYYELRHNGQFVDPQAVMLPVEVKGKVR
jgi:septal ring factor EnvC (AmiA/AmiB activator)